MHTDTALVVFCRRPLPGIGKQRIARALGARAAFEIGAALLDCALEDAVDWPHALVLSPAEAADAEWARSLLDRPMRIAPQPAGNLGERLAAVDVRLRADGLRNLLFIGSDAPALTLDTLLGALACLERADVVVEPARDGGVTLMGARKPWPELADLPWSSSELGAALERRCAQAGLSTTRLPPSFDVDERADLAVALAALAADPRPARRRLLGLLRSLATESAA
jgi:hypothetical protein